MEITVEQLKHRQDAGEQPILLDVRQEHERTLVNIGGVFIPMHEIPARYTELDPAAEIIVYCHMGGRSHRVVEFLAQKGFTGVKNLIGGIDAWAVKIDPAKPRY